MKKISVREMAIAGLLTAVAVVGSTLSFPVFASQCAPVQHMVNVVCAAFLGPWYGVGVAFAASLIRNLLGLGTLMAFPGSMFGALLCGLVWKASRNIPLTCAGEVFGTAILGGLAAYPVAIFLLGVEAGTVAFYGYIIPFFVSTSVGAVLAGLLLGALSKVRVLQGLQSHR